MWYYMSSRPDVFADTTEQGIEWVKKLNYAFLVESATNEYNVQRHCELMQVGKFEMRINDDLHSKSMQESERKRDESSVEILIF